MSRRARRGTPAGPGLLKLEEMLCFAVYSASRAFVRAYTPLLAPLGLTYLQYIVMLVLWDRDGQSVRALGDRLALDSGTLSPLLKRLEEAGFLERRRARDDERVVIVALSPAGRALQARASQVPFELACRAGYEATDEGLGELAALRDAVQAVARQLDAATQT